MAIDGTDNGESINGTTGNDMIYGFGGDDMLFGGDGNDVLYGGDGDDDLFGGNGNDQLSGGEGADYMVGGTGNDTFFVSEAGDQAIEGAGEGSDTVQSLLANYTLGANLEIVLLREGAAVDAAGRTNANGNELNNGMRGNSGANTLSGKGGNDSIYGMGGDDILNGGTGNDLIDGGAGDDLVSFKVDGGTQGATVDLSITTGQNTGFGTDQIRGVENLEGTQNNDVLSGNNGVNRISSLGGDDLIRGRGGDDDLTSGTGNDTFRFDRAGEGNGVDRIRNFVVGSDRLEFRTSDGYAANSTLTFGSEAEGTGPQGIYDITTGMLYYDADGEGGDDAILIAQFDRGVNLTGNDIAVINDGTPTL